MDKVNMLGIQVDVIDQPDLLCRIDELAEAPRVSLVNNVNIHACNLAYEDAEFRKILNQSDVVFCDGFGVKLGALLKGQKLGQRMTPPDWIDDLFRLCVQKNYRVFFVGDEQDVVELFVDQLTGKYPDLEIAGFHHGFFEPGGPEDQALVDEINASEADVVITGMGMPRQEKWAWQHREDFSKGVFIATGALFRWYTGYEKRCPRWMSQHGLEWLGRLMTKPLQHFRRYVVGIPLFLLRVITERTTNGH